MSGTETTYGTAYVTTVRYCVKLTTNTIQFDTHNDNRTSKDTKHQSDNKNHNNNINRDDNLNNHKKTNINDSSRDQCLTAIGTFVMYFKALSSMFSLCIVLCHFC